MTDKERLEEIEKNLDPLGYGMGGHLISVNDIHWLVKYARKQAERVQELEEEVDRLNRALHYQLSQENIRNEENRKLKYKNKRYREAIKECLERMNEGGAGTRSFVYEKLIEVLEGEK